MKIVRFVSLFAVLMLALTAVPQEYSPIPDVHAKPPPDKGSKGKGKPDRNISDQGSKGKGKSDTHAGGKGKKNQQLSKQFHKGKWDRDWDAGDFLAAGFTASALYEILGVNKELLHTGASSVPPGIRMNLARGKPLPPGIAMKRPDGDLATALPRVLGHEWREIGRDLVLISAGSQIVTQIIRDVLS